MGKFSINPYYFSHKKRGFDLTLALILLAILSPLFIIIGLSILSTSGSPIIFKQKRAGKKGKHFTIFKFRTMKKNADLIKHRYLQLNEAPLPMFKIHNDPRFVGIGRFLSKTGLDELPQLINIIRGEMSFVGPRPLPTKEAENLVESWRHFREKVKPGVFSDWSLSNERHKNLKNWRRLEKKTLKAGSLFRDISYLIITPISQIYLLIRPKEKSQTK